MTEDHPPADTAQIGFIGLGNIGQPMALTLLEHDFELVVYDVRSEAMTPCVEAGATPAADAREVASTCDIIEIVVRSRDQVESLILGEAGILTALSPGDLIIIHSTIPPSSVRKVATAADEAGVGVIDAAVSGGDIGAEQGTLTVMVGGPPEAYERARPLFSALGEDIFHLGAVGTGMAAKLGNNIMAHCNHLVALEAMKLARAYGIAEEDMADVAAVSTGGSWMVENWGFYDRFMEDHTLAGTDELYFFMRHSSKDAMHAAEEMDVALPITGMCTELRPRMLSDRYEQLQD